MEETVMVFDVNILWAIPLGIIIGASLMWFWLKRNTQPKGEHKPTAVKKVSWLGKTAEKKRPIYKEPAIPDSEYAGEALKGEKDKLADFEPNKKEEEIAKIRNIMEG